MNQFKTKKRSHKINCGLLNYPILMSADILLYKSHYVPIGYDQIQHLELTRNIAKRLNNLFSFNLFNIPKYILSKTCSRIMSLLKPEIKMSKSDINKNNVIFLLDKIENVKLKIKYSITDSQYPPKIFFDKKNKPGISNLLNIISGIKNIPINVLEKEFYNFSYKKFKEIVFIEISNFLISLQKRYFFFRKKKFFLRKILLNGKYKAKKYAKKNMLNILNIFNINYF